MSERNPHVIEAQRLALKCSKILAGHDPDVQGAAIGELFATFIAGHAPGLRAMMRELTLHVADDLVPIIVEMMIESGRAPPEWRGGFDA